MTTPDLLKDLEAVALLAEKATPGKWRSRPEDGVVILGGNCGGFSIEHCPDASSNAKLIVAAVNFLRTHHAEIAEAVSNSIPMSQLVELLPGAYYMDPPDGGDVSVIEQLRRMTRDAARYRWLRADRAGQAEEVVLVDRYGDVEVKIGDDLDAAIDAQHNSAREGLK